MLRIEPWLRLRSRVFAYGLGIIFASATTVVAVSFLMLRRSFHEDTRGFSAWIAPKLCEELPGKRATEGPSMLRATMYAADGAMRGTFVEPPIPALTPAQLIDLRGAGGTLVAQGPLSAFWCPAAEGYVVLGPTPVEVLPKSLAVVVLAVIALVALSSLPFARSITGPIERIGEATRAFGRGDLSARAEGMGPDEVGDLGRAFNDMAERLDALIRAEKELLANVSHELRTPLARIRIALEMAQENPKRAQALLGEISHDLADLENLVNSVMDSVRLEVGKVALKSPQLPVRLQPTDVGGLVTDVVVRFRDVHPERTVSLEVADAPVDADADARLLRRLVDNLLENAHKYSRAGVSIRVAVRRHEGQVVVSVADEGIGIDARDLPRVFEPFFRSDPSRSRETGGVGLGLALVKKIADVHRGQLEIESEVGVGTTVTLRLDEVDAPP